VQSQRRVPELLSNADNRYIPTETSPKLVPFVSLLARDYTEFRGPEGLIISS